MSKVRIAFLQHGLHYGGAAISLYLLQKSLSEDIFEKYLLITPTSLDSPEMKKIFMLQNKELYNVKLDQIHNHQCGETPFYKYNIYKKRSCESLIQYLIKRNIDILHINSTVFPHIIDKVKSHASVKIVTHIRELIKTNNKLGNNMIKEISKHSDAIIAISDNEARPFTEHRNLYILPNPFDFSKMNSIRSSFRTEQNISDDCVIVGMLGQFQKSKGQLVLLQTLREIVQNYSTNNPFIFVILGKTVKGNLWKTVGKKILRREDYLQLIEKYIKDNKLGPFIKLLPYTLDIFDVLSAIDIVVRPSLSGDPWGRDIIEAMAFRKPVVATGTSEFYITNGETGYLIPPLQPKLMAEKITELINNPEKRKYLGEKGYLRVREMCDMAQYGKKMAMIYKSVLS